LRSLYPVGVALSGGLDSSSVASMAQTLVAGTGPPPIHTFSAAFNDVPQCDERPFIHAVIAQGGFEPHDVHLDRLGALTDIDQVLWHQDQPLYIRNVYLWIALYRAAQQQGIRVMLDGEDGDTVVSHGEGYLAELARTAQWAAFAREAKALFHHFQSYGASPTYWLRAYGFPYLHELARAGRWITFVKATDEIARYFAVPRWRLFLTQGLRPLAPERVRRAWRTLHGYVRAEGTRHALINPRLARRVDFAERTSAMFARHTPVRSLKEEHWLSLTGGITSCTHEEDNKTAAAFAIEPRHPFWDRRVVEFCLALPPEQKLRQGWARWVLRHAMAAILPEVIQWRVGKSNLSPNFTRSLLILERERLEEALVQDPQDLEAYVDMSVMREAYRRRDANTMWPAVILALWLRRTGLTPAPTNHAGR
jgi:asparagine synthase (glutamine-hydrolysing)